MTDPVIKSGWLRVTIYLFAMIVVIAFFGAPAVFIITGLTGFKLDDIHLNDTGSIYVMSLYQAVFAAIITGLTIFFIRVIDGKKTKQLGFQKYRRGKDFLLGMLTGFAIIGTGFGVLALSGYISITGVSLNLSYLTGSIVLCILISWMEEISFRSYILNNLLSSFNQYNALLISAILFALFHGFNPGITVLAFINLILAGIILGIGYLHTRTIWFALSLHFSWNFFQGPVFGFPVSGLRMNGIVNQGTIGVDIISGGEFGFEGSLLCTVLVIACIIVLDRYYNKTLNNTFDLNMHS
jgi:uncharacterized protein